VDRLVAKERELIERLKEKRTALISRTVTRGLPAEAAAREGLPANPPLKPLQPRLARRHPFALESKTTEAGGRFC